MVYCLNGCVSQPSMAKDRDLSRTKAVKFELYVHVST